MNIKCNCSPVCKITMIVLIVLVISLVGYIIYDKKSSPKFCSSSGGIINNETENMVSKTVLGKIIEINDQKIKIEQIGQDLKEEKEVKINDKTEFYKYKIVNDQNGQKTTESIVAKASDFKKDDYVTILLDKNPTESNLTAVTVDEVLVP